MRTRQLGHTGAEVSQLCLGTMYFGTRVDPEMSRRVLDAYVEAGGTFLDTANGYAHWIEGWKGGESETLLGKWMRERGNRAQLFLATKVGFDYPGVERGLRARVIEEECEKSLRRLGVDYIDLYYAHVDDRNTLLEETLEAFDRLVKAGKVRFIGASNYLAWRLEQARCISQMNNWASFCCIQQRYTYLPLQPGQSTAPQVMVNDDLLDYCRSTGMTLLAYSVLLGGAYTREDRPLPREFSGPGDEVRLSTLRAIAEETGGTVNQVVMAWMMQLSPSILPIIAASNEEQLRDNLGALDIRLSDEQMERLNSARFA
ncbi:MAG: aldo/keto reductase [Chloroflexota bacterium]|nr:MAG: aldo/keto reductase [Chloroflexota bacterium]